MEVLKTKDILIIEEYIKQNNLFEIKNTISIVKYLLKNNELNTLLMLVNNNLNINDYIMQVIEKGDLLSLSKLLSININFEFEDKYGVSPYLLACIKKDVSIISLLENNNIGNNYKVDSTLHDIILSDDEDIALKIISELIEEKPYLLYRVDNNFNTPLILSILQGYRRISSFLIDHGVEIFKRNKDLHTAVYFMIECNDYLLFKRLIKNKKIIENGCYENKVPLYVIIMKDKLDFLKLIVHENNINTLINSESLVEIAVQYNAINILNYLVEYNADLDYTSNIFKQCPLVVACKLGFEKVALKLLDGHVNINHSDGYGKLPIDYAIDNNLKLVIKKMTQKNR